MPSPATLSRIGLVVHPSRDLAGALDTVRRWSEAHGVDVVQVAEGSSEREVAPLEPAASCDVIVAVGGDGTVLAAIRAAADAKRPVVGVSCGSLGALATVDPTGVTAALDRFAAGDWAPLELPALAITTDAGAAHVAFNDLVVVRDGAGQISASAAIDGVLYGRFAGDGLVVSTGLGSSGYGMAAGGPVVVPGADAFSMTPLAPHGGCVPPVVMPGASTLRLVVDPGHGGARTELDGRHVETDGLTFDVVLRPAGVSVVRFGDEEPVLTGLRRRGIIADGPRILARDARLARSRVTDPPSPAA
jgi:NAD+ kinase